MQAKLRAHGVGVHIFKKAAYTSYTRLQFATGKQGGREQVPHPSLIPYPSPSPLTPHLSPFTHPHPSPLPLTSHPSPLTPHSAPSPITPYPSPDTITPQVMHVEAVDLAPIIQRMYSHLGKGGIITAKMDIEGDEFALLPHLERSQALCLISRIQILWHPQYYDEKEGRKAAAALGLEADVSGAKASEASVRQMQLDINEIYAHPTGECKAWLQEKQDITYEQDDGNDDDWPQGACKAELD